MRMVGTIMMIRVRMVMRCEDEYEEDEDDALVVRKAAGWEASASN